MEKLNLSKVDLKFIETIIMYTSKISDLNHKLYELEKSGQKDSDEYTQAVKNLKLLLELEEELYEISNLNTERWLSIGTFIKKQVTLDNNFINIDTILFDNEKNRIYKRILIKINQIINSDFEYTYGTIPKEQLLLMQMGGMNVEKNALIKSIYNGKVTTSAFEEDIINIILYFIEKNINDEGIELSKEDLIKQKYYIMFLNRDVERKMIENNFLVKSIRHDSIKQACELLDITSLERKPVIDIFSEKIVNEKMENLLLMTDQEYLIQSQIENHLKLLLMRACLTVMSKDMSTKIFDRFYSTTYHNSYIDRKLNRTISKANIWKIFMSLKNDRGKYRVISFEETKRLRNVK